MKFTKMHGCGNDYVYINCFNETVEDPSALAIKVSDRHFGIGSDGLILICPSTVADFRMRMFNADGSEGEMCGNGIRCVAKYVYDHGMTDAKKISIETGAGIKYLDLTVEDGKVSLVKVDMGEPVFNYAVAYDTHNQEPLFYEKYTAICALEHPMAGKTVPLEEFMKEPLLSREKSSGAYEVFQSAVNQTGLTVTPVWESTSQTTLMEAVHYGLGVTIVPEQMIKREVREGRLSQITFSDFSFQNTIHIAYHHSKYLSPSIKKFILLVKTLDPPESVPE